MDSATVFIIFFSYYFILSFSEYTDSIPEQRNQRHIVHYQPPKYTNPKRRTLISTPLQQQFYYQKTHFNVHTTPPPSPKRYRPGMVYNRTIIFRDEDELNEQRSNHQAKMISQTSRMREGSFCRRSFDGKSGYCLKTYNCLHIIKEFRENGVKIDFCSHKGTVPVICCPLQDKEIDREDSIRISVRKCGEYYEEASRTKPRKRNKNNAKKCVSSIPLIVGGERTSYDEYPNMAAVGWTKPNGRINFACGGSLINEQFVLTASHCTEHGGKKPDVTRLGAHYLNSDDDSIDLKIIEVFNHPDYKESEYYNDIALLKLDRLITFTKYIKPACLWPYSGFDEVELATATGWGRTSYLGLKSNELLKVDLEIIDNKICNKLYSMEYKLPKGITNKQFCAGYLEGGKDTCQGDSGGPIHVQKPKFNCVPYVLGVTSFGKVCAASNAPGVYTKIYAYLDWIEEIAF